MSGSSGTDRMPEAATTNGADEPLPVSVSHVPDRGVLVEGHRDDRGVERDVAAQVEPVGDEVQVGLDLRLGRHGLGPHPLLLDLVGEAVGVLDALDVTRAPGYRLNSQVPPTFSAASIARTRSPSSRRRCNA